MYSSSGYVKVSDGLAETKLLEVITAVSLPVCEGVVVWCGMKHMRRKEHASAALDSRRPPNRGVLAIEPRHSEREVTWPHDDAK